MKPVQLADPIKRAARTLLTHSGHSKSLLFRRTPAIPLNAAAKLRVDLPTGGLAPWMTDGVPLTRLHALSWALIIGQGVAEETYAQLASIPLVRGRDRGGRGPGADAQRNGE